MEHDYKRKIIHLLELLDDENFLRYIYILISEMVTKNKG
jgi:hypothetical protein